MPDTEPAAKSDTSDEKPKPKKKDKARARRKDIGKTFSQRGTEVSK